jgi:hypothetical protein
MVERQHLAPQASGHLPAARTMHRGLFESVSFGSQAFSGAAAFNQNIAAWNVLRVSNFVSIFVSTTALSSSGCSGNQKAIFDSWGSTFQLQQSTVGWSTLCTTQTAITNANINTAATVWLTSPNTAETTYGPIADWNTAAVTSMANLFYSATGTFNIGSWNVASVSNMDQV